ncbi:unnamed protein product, partial [Didymodactylos carnosus]
STAPNGENQNECEIQGDYRFSSDESDMQPDYQQEYTNLKEEQVKDSKPNTKLLFIQRLAADTESIATISEIPIPNHKSDVEAFLDDLFERALLESNLNRRATKVNNIQISTYNQKRFQLISNSKVEPLLRQRTSLQKKDGKRKVIVTDASLKSKKPNKKSKHMITTIANENYDELNQQKKRRIKKKDNYQNLNRNNSAWNDSMSSFLTTPATTTITTDTDNNDPGISEVTSCDVPSVMNIGRNYCQTDMMVDESSEKHYHHPMNVKYFDRNRRHHPHNRVVVREPLCSFHTKVKEKMLTRNSNGRQYQRRWPPPTQSPELQKCLSPKAQNLNQIENQILVSNLDSSTSILFSPSTNNNIINDNQQIIVTNNNVISQPFLNAAIAAKNGISLIPLSPSVCLSTTIPGLTTTTNISSTTKNGPMFVPVIEINYQKYLPVYLKQKPASRINQKLQNRIQSKADDEQDKPILCVPKPQNKTTSQLVITQKNNNVKDESQYSNIPHLNGSSPIDLKLNVQRLSMSNLDKISGRDNLSQTNYEYHNGLTDQISNELCQNDNPNTNIQTTNANKQNIKLLVNHSSVEVQQQRAKTIRIGKVRWPPALNQEETITTDLDRRTEIQRRIHEEILGHETSDKVTVERVSLDLSKDHTARSPEYQIREMNDSMLIKCIPIGGVENHQSQSEDHSKKYHQSFHRTSPLQKQPLTSSADKDHKQILKINGALSSSTEPTSLIDSDLESANADWRMMNGNNGKYRHKTLTPMIGKENFELRKKLFERLNEKQDIEGKTNLMSMFEE